MKAEAKVIDEAGDVGLDEQGDATMESTTQDDDDYASKLAEMVNEAMEEGDDFEEGCTYSEPTESQNRHRRASKDRIDDLKFTTEESNACREWARTSITQR